MHVIVPLASPRAKVLEAFDTETDFNIIDTLYVCTITKPRSNVRTPLLAMATS